MFLVGLVYAATGMMAGSTSSAARMQSPETSRATTDSIFTVLSFIDRSEGAGDFPALARGAT